MLGTCDDNEQSVDSPINPVVNPASLGLSNSARAWSSEGHVAMTCSASTQASSRIMYASTHSARHTQAQQVIVGVVGGILGLGVIFGVIRLFWVNCRFVLFGFGGN